MDISRQEFSQSTGEVGAGRVANRILNGLGKEYQGVKYGLKARSGDLKVEVVTEHLLAAEMELNEEKENLAKGPTTTASASVSTGNIQVAATIKWLHPQPIVGIKAHTLRPCLHTHCGTTHVTLSSGNEQPYHNSGPQRTNNQQRYRRSPYTRGPREQEGSLQYYHCSNFDHTANNCWVKFPNLKPQWMKDADEWRRTE